MDGFSIFMIILAVLASLSFLPTGASRPTNQTGGARGMWSKMKYFFVLFLIILGVAHSTQN